MPSAGGLSGALAQQTNTQGGALFGQSQGIQNSLTPFFQNEMYNPQGFGPTTLSSIMTQEGQGTAGALGGARQSAMDIGARTGNLSAIPQLIGGANKAGVQQMSNLSGQLGIANANERMSQQQAGASGLSGIMGHDLAGSTAMYGQENEAIKNLQAAQNSGFGHELGAAVAQAIPAAAGGFAGGLGGAMGSTAETMTPAAWAQNMTLAGSMGPVPTTVDTSYSGATI
jgi:hypothetical protein